ncbi:MAG: primosomal protein N' [Desulfovibrio sp.]|jgi:primosomal protein N' (replication factor Y)|nr:primosomal protein N' [Desulfovibrio sp.]
MSASFGPVARVALLSPHFAALSYALPGYLPDGAFFVGQRVAVPLSKGLRVGLITAFAERDAGAEYALKSVLWPLDRERLLPEACLEIAVELARRQGDQVGRILAGMLPAGLRASQMRIRFFGQGRPCEKRLKDLAALSVEELADLGRLWTAGRVDIRRSGKNPLDAEVCLLASDPPWPVRPAALAQSAMLEYLLEHGPRTRRKLGEALGPGAPATIATLARRGLVLLRPADAFEPESLNAGQDDAAGTPPPAPAFPAILEDDGAAFVLTPEQRAVFTPLSDALKSDKAETRLLYGITGSGKTAVYLELARECLSLGKSVLLLAPEVALAMKLRADANVLPQTLIPETRRLLFHGYQSPNAREAAFRALCVKDTGPWLVTGTRSALLLPLSNIGLIVLDEEHDASFKQDEGLTYQAKEVAWFRAGREGALLLLGSATPDVKSFYAARQGLIPLHTLDRRVGGGALPTVELVPLSKESGSDVPLAPESMAALQDAVSRGEQAVILLNRRGYAPLMYCLSCNAVTKCPDCDIALAYHKGRERLVCHYCGWSTPYPSPCSGCGSLRFLPMGEGTEKLEEGLGAHLPPGTGVLRLDRDSTRRTGRMEEILSAFARKEASVLVGTQMLSKGHHFPDVTLAIVADADLGLNLPDYRAAERTFQLLVQSAGRAGRGLKPGRVLIQTRDPGHYCWRYVKNADYQGFFEREIALRRQRGYPPFVRLALIRISHDMRRDNGPEAVMALGASLRKTAGTLGVTLLGPAPAPLPFLKGRRRWHCLLKGTDWPPLRALYAEAQRLNANGFLRLGLDLDPVNML